MERGRFVADPLPAGCDEAALVLQWAGQLAADAHRGITLDDLRYAIHLVATGRSVSSTRLNQRQIDRVFALLDLLHEPDNLTFVMNWMNPEGKSEGWLREFIRQHFHDDYVATLCTRMHAGRALGELPKPELMSLLRTLRQRPNALKQTAANPF
jgi:hypothetical protein